MADLREDALAPPAGPGEQVRLPDPPGDGPPGDGGSTGAQRSLLDDIEALIDDGRTYLNAELSYQKTRASFVSDRLKKTIVFGGGAALLGFLALIGLTVGLIIALTPLLTGWGATAVVVGLLLLGTFLLLRRAARNWTSMMGVVRSDDPEAGDRATDQRA